MQKPASQTTAGSGALIGWPSVKWPIAAGAAAMAMLGLLYALVRTPGYEMVSAIAIGEKSVEKTGASSLIETPESVVIKLNDVYLPLAQTRVRSDAKLGQARVRAAASQQKNGTIVLIRSIAKPAEAAAHAEVHKDVGNTLLKEHARVTTGIEAAARSQLSLLRAELIATESEESLKQLQTLPTRPASGAEGNAQPTISTAAPTEPASIAAAIASASRKRELKAIDRRQKELRLAALKQQVEAARGERARASAAARSPTEALAVLLIDADLQKQVDEMAKLEQALLVTDEAAEIDSERARTLALTALRSKISDLESQVANIRPSRALMSAVSSPEPAGVSGAVIVLLCAVLGAALGLLTAYQLGAGRRQA